MSDADKNTSVTMTLGYPNIRAVMDAFKPDWPAPKKAISGPMFLDFPDFYPVAPPSSVLYPTLVNVSHSDPIDPKELRSAIVTSVPSRQHHFGSHRSAKHGGRHQPIYGHIARRGDLQPSELERAGASMERAWEMAIKATGW